MSLATRKEVSRQVSSKEARETPIPQMITCASNPYSYYDELPNIEVAVLIKVSALRKTRINDAILFTRETRRIQPHIPVLSGIAYSRTLLPHYFIGGETSILVFPWG